jgi:hypothetical protein
MKSIDEDIVIITLVAIVVFLTISLWKICMALKKYKKILEDKDYTLYLPILVLIYYLKRKGLLCSLYTPTPRSLNESFWNVS